MELKDIAAVSGKPGLWKVVKPTRTGFVLESMDEKKMRLATTPQHRVSLLHEISIYTNDYDKTIPLQEVLVTIHKEFGDDPGVTGKSDPEELKAFMAHIVPDYDQERVYVSDMKKLVTWYALLAKNSPGIFEVAKENDEVSEEKQADDKKAENKK